MRLQSPMRLITISNEIKKTIPNEIKKQCPNEIKNNLQWDYSLQWDYNTSFCVNNLSDRGYAFSNNHNFYEIKFLSIICVNNHSTVITLLSKSEYCTLIRVKDFNSICWRSQPGYPDYTKARLTIVAIPTFSSAAKYEVIQLLRRVMIRTAHSLPGFILLTKNTQ